MLHTQRILWQERRRIATLTPYKIESLVRLVDDEYVLSSEYPEKLSENVQRRQ